MFFQRGSGGELSRGGGSSCLSKEWACWHVPAHPLHSGVARRKGYTCKDSFGGQRPCSGNFVDLMVSTLFQKEEKPAEEHPKKV